MGQVGAWVHGRMNFTTGGPVSAARYSKIARALRKATLSCMYLDHGEMIFESRFDEIREIVIGSRPASGFVMFPKQTGPPNTEVSLTYQFLDTGLGPALGSLIKIGGIPIFTELLIRKFQGPDRAAVEAAWNLVEF